ncbi:hypothetical protein U1Q18_025261 [Sarracenia purpurea var. burkii]
MATYFSSEIHADGLQTLYLMNPNYLGYSDTPQQPANTFFLNSAAGNALNTTSISHAPLTQNQQFVGIPLPAVGLASSEDPNRPPVHEIPAVHGIVPRFQYNLRGTIDQITTASHPHIPTAVVATNSGGTADVMSQLGFQRPAVTNLSPTTQQGLSLSLASQQPAYGSFPGEHHISGKSPVTMISPVGHDPIRGSGGSSSSVSNGISGIESAILGSKYLKPAQQILDEVVNVEKAIKSDTGDGSTDKEKIKGESTMAVIVDASTGGERATNCAVELTIAQRQELQMKKAKLVSMLDEVEQRYRQYHQQIQMVVSSFEQAAGIGSAMSYTVVALQTISKQFRCLKDVIMAQIKAAAKSLGDHDASGGKAEGSRLKFFDHQIRQQRALQQLGMIQHNAWRPQRGLPERAVSVLRAWLFEHFLHPYPKDSDKHMLAKQTGLTRSQVSNWFINARVRLWKPMVEEMYLEETKAQEPINGTLETNMKRSEPSKESGSTPTDLQEKRGIQIDRTNILVQSKHERLISHKTHNPSSSEISNSTASTSPLRGSFQPFSGFTLVGYSPEMEGVVLRSPKKLRISEMPKSPSSILSMEMETKGGVERAEAEGIAGKFGAERQTTSHSYSLMEGAAEHGGGFCTYPIEDIGRFEPEQLAAARYNGNGFSLTLGLPHCENLSLSNQNIQLGSRHHTRTAVETHYNGINTPQPPHSTARYENINIQKMGRGLLPSYQIS